MLKNEKLPTCTILAQRKDIINKKYKISVGKQDRIGYTDFIRDNIKLYMMCRIYTGLLHKTNKQREVSGMKHIFIINPVAGKGRHVGVLTAEIEAVCKEKGADYEIYQTRCAGDATEYVKKRSETGAELRFYACGGDGTLGEVARGAYGYPNVQVAVIPCGSGNDFVRSFPGVPFTDIAAQLAGDARKIDLIKTGKGICINLCSVGFDSAVAMSMVHYKSLPLVTGSMAYIIAIGERFFQRISSVMNIVVDGEELPAGEYVIGVCGNGCSYGGGFTAAPRADLEDGLLEIVFVKRLSRAKFLSLIGKYKKGLHLDDPAFRDVIFYRRAKTIDITSPHEVVVNYDGECELTNSMHAEILPAALQFSLPLAHEKSSQPARTRAIRVKGDMLA